MYEWHVHLSSKKTYAMIFYISVDIAVYHPFLLLLCLKFLFFYCLFQAMVEEDCRRFVIARVKSYHILWYE